MLESLLFVLLTVVGRFSLFVSISTFLIGFFRKSKKLKKIGLGIGMIPLLCFGLIVFWYKIAIPSFNKSQMEEFAGIYEPNNSGKELLIKNGLSQNSPQLILHQDGTYAFDSIVGFGLEKKGIWKTGGIDGVFDFHRENGSLTKRAYPLGSGIKSALTMEHQLNKDDFFNKVNVTFIKK